VDYFIHTGLFALGDPYNILLIKIAPNWGFFQAILEYSATSLQLRLNEKSPPARTKGVV
jgi:hypothetical protein